MLLRELGKFMPSGHMLLRELGKFMPSDLQLLRPGTECSLR
jgi:hypothetical protein